jgi:hypothetical protein
MTTGTLPESEMQRLKRWAAEQLDLPRDVSASEARAAFLARLRDEDMMPPLRWQQAHRALAGHTSPAVTAQVLAEEEDRLRDEVESFAVEFFRLEVGPRELRWRELRQQCAFSPPLTARLHALEPGLRVVPGQIHDNPALGELENHLCELFVLRPHERAVRRQQLIFQSAPGVRSRLAQAALSLSKAQPHLAALEPTLIHQLTTWNARAAKRGSNRSKRQRQTAAIVSGGGSSGGNTWGSYWWVAIIALIIIRALSSTSSTSRTYVPPRNTFLPPTFPRVDFRPVTFPRFDPKEWEDKWKREPGKGDGAPGEATRRLLDGIIDPEVKKRVEESLKENERRKNPFSPGKPDTRPAPPP